MNKKIFQWTALCVFAMSVSVFAFKEPSKEQLEEAAQDPSKIVELLEDASVDQAAEVAKNIIVEIVKLKLEKSDRNDRVKSMLTYLFQTMPSGDWNNLSSSLGRSIASSPMASIDQVILASMQQAIIELCGASTGSNFGNAYALSQMTTGGTPGGGKSGPPQLPPPPVALPKEGPSPDPPVPPVPPVPPKPDPVPPYEAQRLR